MAKEADVIIDHVDDLPAGPALGLLAMTAIATLGGMALAVWAMLAQHFAQARGLGWLVGALLALVLVLCAIAVPAVAWPLRPLSNRLVRQAGTVGLGAVAVICTATVFNAVLDIVQVALVPPTPEGWVAQAMTTLVTGAAAAMITALGTTVPGIVIGVLQPLSRVRSLLDEYQAVRAWRVEHEALRRWAQRMLRWVRLRADAPEITPHHKREVIGLLETCQDDLAAATKQIGNLADLDEPIR